jgi:hypothetical protein
MPKWRNAKIATSTLCDGARWYRRLAGYVKRSHTVHLSHSFLFGKKYPSEMAEADESLENNALIADSSSSMTVQEQETIVGLRDGNTMRKKARERRQN